MHPKVMLSSRLVSFKDTIVNSSKLMIRLLVNLFKGDWRTVIGRNLGLIRENLRGTCLPLS